MQQWDDLIDWRVIPPGLALAIGVYKVVRRSGPKPWFLWSAAISFLAAPIERDLAKRENAALREDNARLEKENQHLRVSARLSSGGSLKNGAGTPTSRSPHSSPTTHDPFIK